MIDTPDREAAAVDATVASIVRPGPTLKGSERRSLAETARRAFERRGRTDEERGVEMVDVEIDPKQRLAARFAADAHTIRADDVAAWAEDGNSVATYVEILSLVARLSAVDTLHFGLGLDPAPLPEPVSGEPTHDIDPRAEIDGGWVPTVGSASPPNALSLLPGEHRAMHELHGALYLSVAEMADVDVTRDLHRTQLELVRAGRRCSTNVSFDCWPTPRCSV